MKRILHVLPRIGLILVLLGMSVSAQQRSAVQPSAIQPCGLSVEYMNNPVGIDTPQPRFSWVSQAVDENAKNLTQTAYQILVASSSEKLAKNEGDLWSTGKIKTSRSLNVEYQGKPLVTSQRCYWKVRVWDNKSDSPSNWSEPAFWIMGVMKPGDWKAKWVSLPEKLRPDHDMSGAKWIWAGDATSLQDAAPGDRFFRTEFEVPEGLNNNKLILAITADDSYEVDINGKRATQTWGMFNDWSWLRFIDVAEHVKPGKNEIVVKVNNKEPGPTGLILKLNVENNGKTGATLLVSDSRWTASASKNADSKDGGWKPVAVVGDIDCPPWGKIKRITYPVPFAFERNFEVDGSKTVKNATLHITGLGFYEASLNGRVGNKVLDPAPTRYDRRVLYSTYDVTDKIKKGSNRFRVDLGHGWQNVRTVAVWNYDNAPWRDFPRFLAQLEIEFADGSKKYVVSDETWENAPSFIVFDCIRQGVTVEAKESSELPPIEHAVVVPAPKGTLSAESMPGAVITQQFKPVKIWESKPGVYVVDFGQNIAGWVRLTFPGRSIDPEEPPITIRYGERITKDGAFDMNPIDQHFRHGFHGFQTDVVRRGGTGMTSYEPRFVYYGFQYVEITGMTQPPKEDGIVACAVNTDFKQTGHFECSSELFNKIQQATLWSYRSNYADGYPTDCPHREKNGWTGDAHLAAEQAQYNWQNVAAYEKWMQDFRDEQRPDGNLPGIVPTSGWGYAWGNGPAWDSAFVIIPWYLYIYQGDTRVLEKNYDQMKKYVDYMASRAHENGLVDHGLGDWVFAKTETPVVVTSSGYYYVDTMIVAQAAKILGKTDDAKRYAERAAKIRDAYNRELKKENGVYSIGSQTAQSCAIHQRLADPADYPAITKRLLEQVAAANDHLDVGILGAKYLFRTLSETGHTDVAMKILNQKTRPSYGDWFERGATTLWEDWKDGDSRNHIMFGDVSAWFYQTLAGIKLDSSVSATGQPSDTSAIAFKKFMVAPVFADGIDWVKASVDSPYGLIKVDWQRNGKKITLNVSVPVNTTASILTEIATSKMEQFGSGHYTFELLEP
ncbi:MAG: glycoside hydrolase family 78 protein [Planctomycetaceae bacterium]|nr:glycoside hydrolase family 78 protein [Planctomycetaceae bacterium]